ncbi:hypothetical protein AAFP30_20760 [Gordonia sp. CPCC 205515]|uniref:hypothetical protein n=1 Tax=Gordonia sp. CPCC 205515 TaxID=3140791 RepID=UPI003AF36B97
MERNKDLVQELVESTATHVGRIATIITGAVADVAREIGDLVTDGFEMRDAARKARLDDLRHEDDEQLIIDAEIDDELGSDPLDDSDALASTDDLARPAVTSPGPALESQPES